MDGMEVNVLFHADEDRPMSCELPATVALTVTYAEPAVKGNTSTKRTKISHIRNRHRSKSAFIYN